MVYRNFIIGTLLIISGCQSSNISTEHQKPRGDVFAVEQTNERYRQARSFLPANLTNLVDYQISSWQWVNDSLIFYRITTPHGARIMQADLSQNLRSYAFDHDRFAQLFSTASGTEIDTTTIPIQQFDVVDDAQAILFSANGKQWLYHLGNQTLNEYREQISRPPSAVLSPDDRYAAFIRYHNLWVRDMTSGEDTQLTSGGDYRYGFSTNSQGWTRNQVPVLLWSDDSRFISTYRLDEREVPYMYLLETADERAKLHFWPYALPSDSLVPMHERLIVDVYNREVRFLQTEPDHQRVSNCCGLTRGNRWADNQFSSDAQQLAFVSTSRDYTTVTLRVADTQSGAVRTVFSETDMPFFESNLTSRGDPNWRVLFDSDEFIWFSRRDEWGHLYLYDLNAGSMKHPITQGSWNVIDIHRIDTEARVVWFTAVGRESGRDVYQEYLYRVNFDGSELTLLTPEMGNHEISFSPDGTLFRDTWSDYLNPPITVIRNASDGSIAMELEKTDIRRLLQTGFPLPEPFVVKGRDGETDIYGLMFKPSDFDPTRSYPIINSIYPGPQVGSINTRSFSVARRGNPQSMAELGFIVVQMDAMGTPMRSKSFHAAYFGNMIDNGLPDQIAGMRELASRHEWIDIERAGMYGHSGGGYATAAALLTHPDFFKVGVASAGNMDNSGYTYYWGEKFQGMMQSLPDGRTTYSNQALAPLAGNLKGKLLLSYGTMDSNVHPNMTLLLVNELIRQDKDFDLMVFPNRGHGYFNEAYNLRITWDYFVKHLANYGL